MKNLRLEITQLKQALDESRYLLSCTFAFFFSSKILNPDHVFPYLSFFFSANAMV